jgi:dTDP-4-amino-4,6-dideoxygalactose transaminase
MSIPILDLNPGIQGQRQEILAAIESVIDATSFIGGGIVQEFEANVARYLGVKHAVGLNSGTDAITIGLMALGIGPGDEVITTPFTFFATVESILLVGATPKFVDIDPATYNLATDQLEKAVSKRTKAVIPVHLFGHAAEMDGVLAVAKRHGLKVLEDVAQAFSGEFRGKKLGTLGDVGAFSFFPSKNLGAFGDAGMAVTNDDGVAETMRMLRSHGSKKKYFNERVGFNSRLDSLQAGVLNVKLRKIEEATSGRRDAARRYAEYLGDIQQVVLPVEKPWAKHCYHQYTIRIRQGHRDQIQRNLEARGVGTMVYYPVPIHKLPILAGLGLSYPESEAAAAQVLSLPIWPEISPQTQQQVADALRDSFR